MRINHSLEGSILIPMRTQLFSERLCVGRSYRYARIWRTESPYIRLLCMRGLMQEPLQIHNINQLGIIGFVPHL